jgi:hypothetical protein
MTDETTEGTAAKPVPRTVADKANRLIDQTHTAGRGPCTNAEVAACEHDHGRCCPARQRQDREHQLGKAVAVTPRLVGYHYGG